MSTFRVYQWVKIQQKQRQKKQFKQQKNRLHILWVFLAVSGLLLSRLTIFVGRTLSNYVEDSPDLSVIPALFKSPDGAFYHPTQLFDRSGTQLIYQHNHPDAARVYRSVDIGTAGSISPYLIQHMITINEPDFWGNTQIHFNHFFESTPQTLAERLVDRFVLPDETQGMQRTVLLRTLGQELTHTYGKAQVLEWYLNSAYFGQKAYGVESAAQLYFGKTAAEINFSEAVLLAAIEQAPALNPLDSPASSQALYHETLTLLFERNALNTAEYAAAQNTPPILSSVQLENQQPYQAFSNQVMQQLIQRFGVWQATFGGLSVQTTLDLDLQQQVTCVSALQLTRLQMTTGSSASADLQSCPAAYYLPSLPAFQESFTDSLSVSVVVMDVKTGEILAYLGNTRNGIEDADETRHQAASLLTPILSTAAISRGFSPSNLVWDIPPAADNPWSSYAKSQSTYHGPQRLRYAIANDYLFPLLDLFDAIGSEAVWNTAATLGLDNPALKSSQADIFLQGNSASILEISHAYQPIANLGLQSGTRQNETSALDPIYLLKVESKNGSILAETEIEQRSVLSPSLAYLVHHMLQDETARWPSLGYPNLTEIGRTSGVKIGRTAARDESWIVGYTPQRLITVWLGTNASSNPEPVDWQLSAGIWSALIKYAGKNMTAAQWQTPTDISALEVCDPSGKLPTIDCPNTINELFISGNEPITYDDLYRSVRLTKKPDYWRPSIHPWN